MWDVISVKKRYMILLTGLEVLSFSKTALCIADTQSRQVGVKASPTLVYPSRDCPRSGRISPSIVRQHYNVPYFEMLNPGNGDHVQIISTQPREGHSDSCGFAPRHGL